jgi:heptaprenyl diphosphate synthase
MAVHPLWEKYPTIQNDLIETKKVMDKSVKIRNKDITQALQMFFEAGGKLLRPAYFLLFSKFGEADSDKKAYRMILLMILLLEGDYHLFSKCMDKISLFIQVTFYLLSTSIY